MRPIKGSIKKQLDANATRNLLFENAGQIMDTDPEFLAALEELLSSDASPEAEAAYAEYVGFAAHELVQRLYSIHPYLQIGDTQVRELEEIYRKTWQHMRKSRNIKRTLKDFHYPRLSAWLARIYPKSLGTQLKTSPSVQPLTYGEYSAALQLEVLGIDPGRLQEPILDIGCGAKAGLVRHLRAQRLEAYGIDRKLEVKSGHLQQVDWFDYSFQPESWGTIISHMAFSNHLSYAHGHDLVQLKHYLLKMKEILEALQPGGRFHYAPGLPFVEQELSRQRFSVEHEQKLGVRVSVVCRVG